MLVDEQRVDKPGSKVPSSCQIRVKHTGSRYVSRGGFKLEAALQALSIIVAGKTCVDLGSSTGGFTDCLLQHGARRVYALDVGQGQLDWRLRQDPRVVAHEGINVRFLERSLIAGPVDLITIDLAFISLKLVLPRLAAFPEAQVLALVKPQFEAERDEVEHGGVIRDAGLQLKVLRRVKEFALGQSFQLLGETPSVLLGKEGNQEYFVLMKYTSQQS